MPVLRGKGTGVEETTSERWMTMNEIKKGDDLNKRRGDSDFSRGYLCAVAQLIRMQGVISTESYELFKALGGSLNDADEPDFKILYAHAGELTRRGGVLRGTKQSKE